MTARSLRAVRDEDAGRRTDPYETRIPGGDYSVVLVGEQRQTLFGRPTWRTRWRVVDGEHLGVELYAWWAIPQKPGRGSPSGAYRTAVEIMTERRAPRDFARRPPSYFMGECVVAARVRDVARDRNGVERPTDARYSRIAHLLRRVSGAPLALRGGR